MLSAAAVRRHVESALEHRIPGALTPRPCTVRDLAATGVPEVDTLLGGGLPVGAITEVVGPPCSGRTTLAVALLGELTSAGKAVAWVDAADALDPQSAAAGGVDLRRLLWVRCGGPAGRSSPSPGSGEARDPVTWTSSAAPLIVPGSHTPAPAGGCGSPHPRSEALGLSEAIDALLQPKAASAATPPHGADPNHSERRKNRVIGTPGAPNRELTGTPSVSEGNRSHRPRSHEEQVATDRLPPRRGVSPRPLTAMRWQTSHTGLPSHPSRHPEHSLAGDPPAQVGRAGSPVWKALDQALRATDLLLTAGGFSALVLDLGSTPREFAWRIPLATWFRLRAAAERARTVLVLLTQHPCARSTAELVLHLHTVEAHGAPTVLTAARFHLTVDRQRFQACNSVPDELPSSGEQGSAERRPQTLHLVSTGNPQRSSARKPPQSERASTWDCPAAWARGGQ